MEDIQPVHLLLMANTIRTKNFPDIMNIFDLKGSIVNRFVPPSKKLKNTSTLKDVNLQFIKQIQKDKKNDFLKFRESDIKRINAEIEKDTQFFLKYKLMDYSLLLAIEEIP